MITASYQNTPTALSELDSDFVKYFGMPALLTIPCKGPEKKAYDFSRNKSGRNTGTLNGGVTVVPASAGIFGAGWKLNGTNQYLLMPDMKLTSAWVSMTIVPTTVTGDLRILSQASGATNQGGALAINQSSGEHGSVWVWTGGAMLRLCADATLVAGQRNHLDFLFFGGTCTMYFNGQVQMTQTSGFAFNGVPLTFFGKYVGSFGNTFPGVAYQVSLFKTQPTAAQVSTLYNSLKYGKPFKLFATPRIRRLYSFGTSNIPLALTGKSLSYSFSESRISTARKLSAQSESQSLLSARQAILQGLYSQSIDQSINHASENIGKALSSKALEYSIGQGNTNVLRKLHAESTSQTSLIASYASTKFELLSMRRYSSQYFVQSGSAEDTGQ